MFDSYHDDVAADEAAEEARRVEMAAVSASEGSCGDDGDWAEAACNEAALVARNAPQDFPQFDDWADEDLTPSQKVAREADDLYGGAFENAVFTPNPEFQG